LKKVHRIRRIVPWLVSLAITLGLGEVALRVIPLPFLRIPVPAYDYWHHDDNLGWARKPNDSGPFSNGRFDGFFTNDADGNRLNGPRGTYVEGYANIFFVGDSTVASLEVHDDETVPALFERGLRARGIQVNVINMGVRGYGTDQSVRKAISFGARYQPTDVIYMYSDNDIYDNNILQRAHRTFGKGVYVRRVGRVKFEPYQYPVPKYPANHAGLVVFDPSCSPVVYEQVLELKDEDGMRKHIDTWLRRHVYLFGGLRFIARTIRGKQGNTRAFRATIHPYAVAMERGIAKDGDFGHAYRDNGLLRMRCRAYFDAQIRFLLTELRQRMDSSPRVHVVQWLDESTLGMLRNGEESPNVTLFETLRAEGIVDTYVNLPAIAVKENLDVNRYRCIGDAHLCAAGNEWLAARLLERIPME